MKDETQNPLEEQAKKDKANEAGDEHKGDEHTIEIEVGKGEEEVKVEKKQEQAPKADESSEALKAAQAENAALKAQLEAAQAKAKQQEENYIRLHAEWDNYRKRKDKEYSDRLQYAHADLLKEFLPIMDNIERTLKSIEKTDNLAAVKEGIELVAKNIHRQFDKVGLSPIESIDQEFDYELHEAISSIPVEEEEKKGKVIDEVEKGYKFKDRVIRFSKVVVGE